MGYVVVVVVALLTCLRPRAMCSRTPAPAPPHAGPTGQINDYAAKAWNGLVGDYYFSRWQLFVHSLYACVGQDPVPASCDDNKFPASYEADLLALEQRWGHDHTEYPTEPIGMCGRLPAAWLVACCVL